MSSIQFTFKNILPKLKRSCVFFILFSFCLIGNSLQAQLDGFILVGDATNISGNNYQLTAATMNQAGAIWNRCNVDLSVPFSISGTMNFGTGDDPGADGIAFVLQNESTTALTSGGGIGYQGIPNSLIAEFDTYQNNAAPEDNNDPVADHIGLLVQGNPNHISGGLGGLATLPNFEDGNDHTFTISWNPGTNLTTIIFDGIMVINQPFDITQATGLRAFWGFTSSTGGEFNTQSVNVTSVTGNSLPTIEVTVGNGTCATTGTAGTTGTGTADATVSCAVAPVSYLWSDGQTTPSATGLLDGTYTVTITDDMGDTGTRSFTITGSPDSNGDGVADGCLPPCSAPTALCTNTTVQLDGTGNATISVIDINNGSSGLACGGPLTFSITGQTSFTCADAGNSVNVTLNVMNTEGTSTCASVVTVANSSPPVANCTNVTVNLDASGNGSVTVADIDNGSSTVCGTLSLSLSGQTAFTCANIGAATVTLTASDGNGGNSTCDATVTVADITPPTALCSNITASLSATNPGTVTISPTDVDNGSNDNCGIASLSIDNGTFTCANVGTPVNVTLTVTDVNANSSTCTATVTVEDNTPSTALCSNITAILSATNPGTVTISPTDVDNGSSDNCGIASLSIDNGTFTCANVGTPVTVTLTVTDVNANTNTCTATVTTLDQTPPTPVCQAFTAQIDQNGIATVALADVLASASDNCGVVPGGQLTQDAFNCAELGVNNVTVTVTDVNGLSGSCTAAVTVEDSIDPVAVYQNVTVQLDAAGNGAIVPTAIDGGTSDNCSFVLTAAPLAFTCANVGANNVTLTATDPSANDDTCIAVVTVEDNIAPIALCQNVIIMLDANGIATATATQVDNGSNDACGIASLVLSQTDFACDDIGMNPVALTVTDVNGNIASCNATITVQDNMPAVILCRPTVNTINDEAVCGANVLLLPPVLIEENCSITSISNNAPALFPIGNTLVTWTFIDAGGNNTQCTQNVNINDTEDPIIDCGNSFIAYTSWDNCGYPSSLLEGATATDNCPGVVITDDAPNFFAPGQYMVNYTATDAAGNTAVCMQWVKIYDTTKPKLTSCPEDIEVEATTVEGANVPWLMPTGMDNCPGPIILVEENGYAPGGFFELGETPISYRLYDQNGQFVTCEFTVNIVPVGGLSLDLACLPDLDISLNNVASTGLFGWNPPLMTSTCDQCDILASDDFQLIGTLSGHQYYTHTADEMTFAEALAYAENIGVTIAVLEDKKEVPMIENEMPEGNYFIGLIDEEGNGEFTWINGDEFVPADFGVLFENDSEEPATVILNEEGEWEVVLLSEATANFAFEKTCIEWEMDTDIEDNSDLDTNDEPELVEAGTIATITYNAVDECGNVSSCGFEVAFVAEAVAYCEPTGIATDEENPYFIESFSLNGYTVETGDDEGYGDHTDEHFLFTPGEVLEMNTVFAGPNVHELPMYCRIWMDLNNDGDFFDEGELLMQGVDVGEAINELTIPNVNQSVENTVMRIAISRLTYAESCGDFLNGEVEDYTISIVKPEEAQININATAGTTATQLAVYPNPANGELFINLTNTEAQKATLKIVNSVGQAMVIQTVDITGEAIRIDLNSFTHGLYTLFVTVDGQEQMIEKFVVKGN